MTPAQVTREAIAVAAGTLLKLVAASFAVRLPGDVVWGIAVLVAVPIAVCAAILRARTSRGIVPAASVTVGIELVLGAVLLALSWTPGT